MPRPARATMAAPIFAEPVFNEGVPTPDPTQFAVPHPSDAALYRQIQTLLDQDAVGFPTARGAPGALYTLAQAWGPHGPEVQQSIQAVGHIVFQSVGDIGASVAKGYPDELRVSDLVTADCHASAAADRPAFLYLLGDLIYDFGEAEYYFDQFYDPYRNYPNPIFAIPGNHDSFVLPNLPPAQAPLGTFERNFCAMAPTVTPEAGALHRTAMTQPGVYFALDAPFVRILGLFSNALEDPGVVSSEGGKWSQVPDVQLDFLRAQLTAIRSTQYAGAVVLALHHPPFSYAPVAGSAGTGGVHSGNAPMLRDIDTICQEVGVYPHLVLAGHAHNYQRYTRSLTLGGVAMQVPFVVAGGGGHGLNPLVRSKLGSPAQPPGDGIDVGYLDPDPAVAATGLVLERHDDHDFGYLRITVDAAHLHLEFHPAIPGTALSSASDVVVLDLASHTVVPSTAAPARSAGSRRPPGRRGGRPGRARP